MGPEVVRVVGTQVKRDDAGNIDHVRLFMVHPGPNCKDLSMLLDPDKQGAVKVGSNIHLRLSNDPRHQDSEDEGYELWVVDCHGCLVPVQAALARMVDILHTIHEERGMVTRDLKPQNILLPEPEQLGDLNSQQVPSQEVLQALVEGKLKVGAGRVASCSMVALRANVN